MRDCYRFGRFELQCSRGRLLDDGRVAALGARAFELLQVLVERRGRTVTKNELLDLVWPGLVIEENNLAVHVSALRKVLGSEAIATIPGRGYRLALPLDDEPAPTAAPLAHPGQALPALPRLPAPLLGRTHDIDALVQLLTCHRLVTVLGPGGMGKTSVALAAAHAAQASHRDGACWVDLAAVSGAAAVPAAVAQALQLSLSHGGDPMGPLLKALQSSPLLLVLDNAEPVADAVAHLSRAVVLATSGVRVLVTSQLALKVDGEQVFRLGPLSVPPPGTSAARSLEHGAVGLFVEQAKSGDRRFELTDANANEVAELCRRLDGLPLAIKLAAARVPLLGFDGVVSRLEERFKLLASGNRDVLDRQRTLQAALDWSHGLLTPQEQVVFRRLGVFVGGFSIELAAAVAGGEATDEWVVIDCLESLVDHSLVSVDAGDPPRYRLLESAREYALLRQREAGELEMLQRCHATAMVDLFERAHAAYWNTPDVPWLAVYGPEIDNVRAAMDWASLHDTPVAVALYGVAARIFTLQSSRHELVRWGVRIESTMSPDVPAAAAARYWAYRANLRLETDHALAFRCARRAEELSAQIGDTQGRYYAMAVIVATGVPPPAEARRILDEMAALEQADWPPRVRMGRPWANIWFAFQDGRFSEARPAAEAMLALAKAVQSEFLATGAVLWLIAELMRSGDSNEAERLAREMVINSRRRNANELLAPAVLAAALLMKGQAEEARSQLAEFVEQARVRDWDQFALATYYFALLAWVESRHDDAARLFGYADNAFARMDASWMSAAHLRPRVEAALQSAFDMQTLQRLMEEGARLDEEAVCALTFRSEPDGTQNV
jgi:predicted ATPase/DNA-binding winged helix-turn-helix (wHTH) protein